MTETQQLAAVSRTLDVQLVWIPFMMMESRWEKLQCQRGGDDASMWFSSLSQRS